MFNAARQYVHHGACSRCLFNCHSMLSHDAGQVQLPWYVSSAVCMCLVLRDNTFCGGMIQPSFASPCFFSKYVGRCSIFILSACSVAVGQYVLSWRSFLGAFSVVIVCSPVVHVRCYNYGYGTFIRCACSVLRDLFRLWCVHPSCQFCAANNMIAAVHSLCTLQLSWYVFQ